jgi:hypothetical protein
MFKKIALLTAILGVSSIAFADNNIVNIKILSHCDSGATATFIGTDGITVTKTILPGRTGGTVDMTKKATITANGTPDLCPIFTGGDVELSLSPGNKFYVNNATEHAVKVNQKTLAANQNNTYTITGNDTVVIGPLLP